MNGYGIGTATGGDQQKIAADCVRANPSTYDATAPAGPDAGRIQVAIGRVAEAASRVRGCAQVIEAFNNRLLGPPPPQPVEAGKLGQPMGALDELGDSIVEMHRGLDWLGRELERLPTIG